MSDNFLSLNTLQLYASTTVSTCHRYSENWRLGHAVLSLLVVASVYRVGCFATYSLSCWLGVKCPFPTQFHANYLQVLIYVNPFWLLHIWFAWCEDASNCTLYKFVSTKWQFNHIFLTLECSTTQFFLIHLCNYN